MNRELTYIQAQQLSINNAHILTPSTAMMSKGRSKNIFYSKIRYKHRNRYSDASYDLRSSSRFYGLLETHSKESL